MLDRSVLIYARPGEVNDSEYLFGKPICASIAGSDVANELLSDLHGGKETIEGIAAWIAELRSEGHPLLAAEVAARLPSLS